MNYKPFSRQTKVPREEEYSILVFFPLQMICFVSSRVHVRELKAKGVAPPLLHAPWLCDARFACMQENKEAFSTFEAASEDEAAVVSSSAIAAEGCSSSAMPRSWFCLHALSC